MCFCSQDLLIDSRDPLGAVPVAGPRGRKEDHPNHDEILPGVDIEDARHPVEVPLHFQLARFESGAFSRVTITLRKGNSNMLDVV